MFVLSFLVATSLTEARSQWNELAGKSWAEVSLYDSYKWNPIVNCDKQNTKDSCGGPTCQGCAPGGLSQIDMADRCNHASKAGALWTAQELTDYGVTTGQAEFTIAEAWEPTQAFSFNAGFRELGFGRWATLGHGVYCPTVDPDFWFNPVTDSFIWFNSVNGHWTMGKPSVEWWFELTLNCPQTTITRLPNCLPNQQPIVNPDTNCPNCAPPVCTPEERAAVRECDIGEFPRFDVVTGCDTCKQTCFDESYVQTLSLCAIDENPMPFPGACPVCKPPADCPGEIPVCTESTFDSTVKLPMVDDNGCDLCYLPRCRKSLADIPICSDESPYKTMDGCDSCVFVPECETRKLPLCTDSVTYDGEGCRTCQPPIPPCTVQPNRICLEGEIAVRKEDGCLTCAPPKCVPTLELPICTEGASPKDLHGCPACQVPPQCTAEDKLLCEQFLDKIPSCAPGELPKRDPNTCCATCVVDEVVCDEAAKLRCQLAQAKLPECSETLVFAYDPKTCCNTCRPPTPPVKPVCDLAAVKACVDAVELCISEEGVDFVKTALDTENCCYSCKEPESNPTCDMNSVIQCQEIQPVCSGFEVPQVLDNECCASCRREQPSCEGCDDQRPMCVTGVDGPTCAAFTYQKITWTVTDETLLASLKDNNGDDRARAAVIESIRRYCEQSFTKTDCNIYAVQVAESLYINHMMIDGSEVIMEVNYAVVEIANRRTLLGEAGDTDSFVTNAVSDTYSANGFYKTKNAEPNAATASAPSFVLASLMAVSYFLA